MGFSRTGGGGGGGGAVGVECVAVKRARMHVYGIHLLVQPGHRGVY